MPECMTEMVSPSVTPTHLPVNVEAVSRGAIKRRIENIRGRFMSSVRVAYEGVEGEKGKVLCRKRRMFDIFQYKERFLRFPG